MSSAFTCGTSCLTSVGRVVLGLVLCGANCLEAKSNVSDVLLDIMISMVIFKFCRRKSTLWLHKPKERRFTRFATPKKKISATATPRKNTSSTFKKLRTPESLPKRAQIAYLCQSKSESYQ